MNFGKALEALRNGLQVARKGWNGKGMYIELNKGLDYMDSEILPFFVIRNITGSFNTWVPSVSDCLAYDWEIVE